MQMTNKVKYFLLGVSGGVILALIGIDHYAYNYLFLSSLKRNVDVFENAKDKILKDLKLIDQEDIFVGLGSEKNADDFLASHISWQGNGTIPTHDDNLERAVSFLEKNRGWEHRTERLQLLLKDIELDKIDVSWVDKLVEYDHWDFSGNPNLKDTIERVTQVDAIGRIGVLASMPIPSYSQLRDAVMVRFFQLHKQKQDQKGLKIVRQAASLTYSTGLLMGAMSALRIIHNERFIVNSLQVKNWKTVSEETAVAFKRVSWAWVGILNNSVGLKLAEEIMAFAKPKNGICSAALEQSMDISLEREYFSGQFPFESDHHSGFAQLRKLHGKFLKDCHLERLGQALNKPSEVVQKILLPDNPKGFSETNFGLTRRFNVSLIPYFRRAYGYYYSADRVSYMAAYEQL